MKSDLLAACDFRVPAPGFIVEFDDRQHFTAPRKLAFSAYRAERWIALCEHHDERDNDPSYRDQQQGLRPTVWLYARDRAWCSLDPDNANQLSAFADLIRGGNHVSTRTKSRTRSTSARMRSTLRVAMVFPELKTGKSKGNPPVGRRARKPVVPAVSQFAGEPVGPESSVFPSPNANTERSRCRAAREIGNLQNPC